MSVKAPMPVRVSDLVVPLAHEATALRTTETSGSAALSGAVSESSNRPGDGDSTMVRSTPATTLTPGTRTSTTATRTTTTRTTSFASAPSADPSAPPADFSFEELVRAWLDCRRTKRNSASALAFEARAEANLVELAEQLVDGTWRPGRSICFVITRPKPREVWAAPFRDRIVHHLLYNRIAPAIERTFIADSCACIRGRGTLYAAQRLERKVRSITQSWQFPARYLKCDIANFFVAIDKQILWTLLESRIEGAWWRDLARRVLFHDPRPDVELRGDPKLLARIPAHKSLFNQSPTHGLPIGNLSSQFFANVYLNALDHFVKHELRARHYVRYVDDFVLLHESAPQLNAWHDAIAAFLPARLALELNRSKTIRQPIDRGIDFVGHLIRPGRRSIRRRTYRQAITRLAATDPEPAFRTANSYFGLLRQASHSHADRTRLARVVMRFGLAVDHRLTKAYRSGARA